MKPFVRNSVALAFAGALAASAATPVLAGDLAGPGLAMGPVVTNGYYGPRDYRSGYVDQRRYVVEPNYADQRSYVVEPSYAYQPSYVREPSYAYQPNYVREPNYAYQPNYVREPSYAYEPGTPYVAPAPQVVYRPGTCWVNSDKDRGFGYWGSCASSGAALAR